MPKRRLSSSERGPRRSTQLKSRSQLKSPPPIGEFHRFIGLSLSGGKSDRSCLAVIDFFVDQKRVFLTRLFDRIKTEEHISADAKIHEMILQYSERCESVAFDVPISLPKCVACPEHCQGYETCTEPEIQWMRAKYNQISKKKPKKMFTPYTQRPVDMFMQELENENFEVHHALGANLAPLTARAVFMRRRLKLPCIEVNPRIAVWRLGQSLRVSKTHLRHFRSSVGGEEARRALLTAFSERAGLFFYQQDQKLMIESHHAFDAFISAYVGFLKFNGQTEPRPAGFPRQETWVEIPS